VIILENFVMIYTIIATFCVLLFINKHRIF